MTKLKQASLQDHTSTSSVLHWLPHIEYLNCSSKLFAKLCHFYYYVLANNDSSSSGRKFVKLVHKNIAHLFARGKSFVFIRSRRMFFAT